MPNPWYESDKIIFICFPSGAGGYAFRYLLGLSPETDVHIHVNDKLPTRNDGAMHHILMPNNFGVSNLPNLYAQFIFRELHKDLFGLNASEEVFWDKIPNTELVKHIQNILHQCHSRDGKPMQDCIKDKHIIIADHLPIRMVRALFPNAKILKLFRNPLLCMKYFFIKNRMQSIAIDSHMRLILSQKGFNNYEKTITTLDATLLADDKSYEYKNFKNELRGNFNLITIQSKNIGDDAYIVNGDKLFDPEFCIDEYTKILAYCGLEPNLEAAEDFIIDYHSKQFDRLTYQPNLDWEWFKSYHRQKQNLTINQ